MPMKERVAAEVWQIALAPHQGVNVYLAGDVLIDCGTRWDGRRISRALAGVRPSMVALTHGHPDHQGAAAFLTRAFQCPLACHEADRAAVEGRTPMTPPARGIRFLSNLLAGPRCPVDRVLREGDEVGGLRVVETPGHTMGHLCFFRESDGLAIAGDLASNINVFTLQPGLREPPWFFSENVELNRRSILKLVDLHPSVVCFSHGPPVRDADLLRAFADRLRV